MKTTALMTVFGAAVLMVLAGCAAKPADPPGQPAGGGGSPVAGQTGARNGGPGGAGQGNGRRFATIPVQAVTVQVGPLITDNDTAGTVVPVTQSQVAAQVAGVVSAVSRRAGDWVKQGALVVQLDDSALKLAVRNAQSALANARIILATGQQTVTESNPKLSSQLESAKTAFAAAQKNFDSQQKLFDLGGISSSQLDSAQSQLQQAQANVQAAQLALDQNQQSDTQSTAQLQLAVDQASTQLEMAQLNLRNAKITAPFAGQIAAINVTPGSYVGLNTSIFTLVSGEKQINFSEPPSDAPNFKAGDEVTFTLSGKPYPVKIVQAPSAPINGVVPMVAAVPPSVPVSYGAVGTVTYRLTLATGPQIPVAALQTRADLTFVYLIVNGKAVEQPITVLAQGGTTAVVKGVDAGTQVILNPPPGLLAGSSVQAVALPSVQGQAAAPAGAQGAGAQGTDQKNRGAGQRTGAAPGGGRPGQAAQGGKQ
jgi:multidrug resistance efflux pump